MAPKAAKAAFGGAHTAGIYADMTVDGPEIGTLVVIVDRAKNLPNRKSMGKQDPYCAARLGKEAKKTETDKRGGQTPRWDQELRFTVHESPDYYQLKVSVFNDDKKTELVGETRIGLEDIIVPGGGQNDTWHNLHCKGRFAGEIRIELTYYDTRPKEEKLQERQPDVAVDSNQETNRGSLGGPRGSKPLKKRPLPANPTDISRPGMPEHAHSSPLPLSQTAQPMVHQPMPSRPDRHQHRDLRLESTPPSASRDYHTQHLGDTEHVPSHSGYEHRWFNGNGNRHQEYDSHSEQNHQAQDTAKYSSVYDPQDRQHEHYEPVRENYALRRHPGGRDPHQEPHRPEHYCAIVPSLSPNGQGQTPPSQAAYDMYDDRYSESPPTMAYGNSMPDVRPAADPRFVEHRSQRYSLPHSRGYSERSPVHQHSPSDSCGPQTKQPQPIADEDVPPPPPAHRTNSGISPSPSGNGRSQSESCAPVPGTAPLSIRKERGSFSNSPLSQVQTNTSHTDYVLSTSPSHTQHYTHSSAMNTGRHAQAPTAARDAYHRRSISPTRSGHAVPPSLVPGYEPPAMSFVPQNVAYSETLDHDQTHRDEAAPRYQAVPVYHNQPRSHHAATIHSQSPLQALERGPEQRPHRASAPVIQPQAVSPDVRIPPRKSVSPQPESGLNERRGSGVPFGPDSYDALNPYVSSISTGLSSGARYSTPEQAKEAALQHDREKKLGDGPIIGSDGRVIDPSDHLPTDTWAPEPESKTPKKTAQVNFRFRNSPQGAQPMPPSSRRQPHDVSARPASISTPVYSSTTNNIAENISPTTAARARLQKRSRASPAQPNSSPVVPTVNTALQNPVLRSTASNYPLQEHENYGYSSSPTYNRPSPTGIPPPVPGKVPIGMSQEDWRRDPLSEELSRIDIGVGGTRMRRSGYGR
ncbi:MAG: hypothetical protein Q9181_002756 [Wetmoreana brouardii]